MSIQDLTTSPPVSRVSGQSSQHDPQHLVFVCGNVSVPGRLEILLEM